MRRSPGSTPSPRSSPIFISISRQPAASSPSLRSNHPRSISPSSSIQPSRRKTPHLHAEPTLILSYAQKTPSPSSPSLITPSTLRSLPSSPSLALSINLHPAQQPPEDLSAHVPAQKPKPIPSSHHPSPLLPSPAQPPPVQTIARRMLQCGPSSRCSIRLRLPRRPSSSLALINLAARRDPSRSRLTGSHHSSAISCLRSTLISQPSSHLGARHPSPDSLHFCLRPRPCAGIIPPTVTSPVIKVGEKCKK